MLQHVRDYAKCFIANKVTFGSTMTYLGLTIYSNELPELVTTITSTTSLFLIGITQCGYDTYNTYKKTKEHIKKHNTIDERYIKLNNEWYCRRKGLELAIKEERLENKLTS